VSTTSCNPPASARTIKSLKMLTNAQSVLPVPVGAHTSTFLPAEIAGTASRWGSDSPPNFSDHHLATAGQNPPTISLSVIVVSKNSTGTAALHRIQLADNERHYTHLRHPNETPTKTAGQFSKSPRISSLSV